MGEHKHKKLQLKIDVNPPGDPLEGFQASRFDVEGRWPFKDNSISELRWHYGFHMVDGENRPSVMDELYRVMQIGAKAVIITPYYTNMRAVMDYRSKWPPIAEPTYCYFDKKWREANKLNGCKCDFEYGGGATPEPETNGRNRETQEFWMKHYNNSVIDLRAVLTKR